MNTQVQISHDRKALFDTAINGFGDIAVSFLTHLFAGSVEKIKAKNTAIIEAYIEEFKLQGIERKWLQRKNWKKLQEAFAKHKLTGDNTSECFDIITEIKMTAWWF